MVYNHLFSPLYTESIIERNERNADVDWNTETNMFKAEILVVHRFSI